MPRRNYAVGVTGSGDHLKFIIKGRKFLTRYDGLRVMIVASRSGGTTLREVERFARNANTTLCRVETVKLAGKRGWDAAIDAKVSEIKGLMP